MIKNVNLSKKCSDAGGTIIAGVGGGYKGLCGAERATRTVTTIIAKADSAHEKRDRWNNDGMDSWD